MRYGGGGESLADFKGYVNVIIDGINAIIRGVALHQK